MHCRADSGSPGTAGVPWQQHVWQWLWRQPSLWPDWGGFLVAQMTNCPAEPPGPCHWEGDAPCCLPAVCHTTANMRLNPPGCSLRLEPPLRRLHLECRPPLQCLGRSRPQHLGLQLLAGLAGALGRPVRPLALPAARPPLAHPLAPLAHQRLGPLGRRQAQGLATPAEVSFQEP